MRSLQTSMRRVLWSNICLQKVLIDNTSQKLTCNYMTQTDIMQREVLAGPNCNRCGAKMRLFGIESHPTIERTDLHTFVCGQCDTVQTEIAALRP